jgi:hypothetical protein
MQDMKYKLLILFLIFFSPLYVFAQNSTAKPLPVFAEKKAENIKIHNEQVSAYGQGRFDACFFCTARNETNPFAYAVCLRRAEQCLKREEEKPRTCQSGYSYSAGKCVTADEGCKEQYGGHSRWSGEIDNSRKLICVCAEGFGWNLDQTQCSETACPADLIYYSAYRDNAGNFLHGRCQTPADACLSAYGENSVFTAANDSREYFCGCAAGYQWAADGKTCEPTPVVAGFESPPLSEIIYSETVEREKALLTGADQSLARRLSGRILLQTEENGEAWYVEPISGEKYFLGSPARAFTLMKNFGLGATHEFIAGRDVFPQYVAGRILIDVEDSGRAYYINPVDRRSYYLGRPDDALVVMRNLSLGVNNADIRKISVGELR